MATPHSDTSGIHVKTWQALAAGDTLRSRRLAMQTLRSAGTRDDAHTLAVAYLQLAHADLLDSSFAPALAMSQKAGAELEAQGDYARAVEAYCAGAYCTIGLGLHDKTDALLSHCRQIALAMSPKEGAAQAWARIENYTGIAASWRGDHATARAHLTCAIEVLLCANDLPHTLQPLLNYWINDVLALTYQAAPDAEPAVTNQLTELWHQCTNLLGTQAGAALSVAQMSLLRAVLSFLSHHLSLRHAWHGQAVAHLQDCRQRIRPLHEANWLQTLGWWAELQHAHAIGEERTVRYCAMSMLAVAGKTRHQPIRQLARHVADPWVTPLD